jgi:hypothetical protein
VINELSSDITIVAPMLMLLLLLRVLRERAHPTSTGCPYSMSIQRHNVTSAPPEGAGQRLLPSFGTPQGHHAVLPSGAVAGGDLEGFWTVRSRPDW